MIVGITGAKRSGKNTLADGLCQKLWLEHHSFAGPLREFVARILGWSLDELELRKEEPIDWLDGKTPRYLMQTVGTEWGREMIHPELWVRSLAHRIPERAVISDVRFDNEARAILSRGGVVIRVVRPGTGEGDFHASEVPVSNSLVTYTIRNDSTPYWMIDRALCLMATHDWSRPA